MNGQYYRPLVQCDPAWPENAKRLAGGWGWFSQVEVLQRGKTPKVISVDAVPQAALARLTAPRPDTAGMRMSRPVVMGILNATPDSFSDGGVHGTVADAVAGGIAMQAEGADLLDIGGESTRPGADFILPEVESMRTAPVIAGLRAAGVTVPISIDTRKAAVAQAALAAGADLINDVSGFTFDAALAPVAAVAQVPVCVMHAQGDPATMQHDPQYGDVLLDVYDFLAARIAQLEGQGIARSRIIADPGIGFGKTQAHNLTLLARIGLFHSLGVPILLGVSRKRFIGTIGGAAGAGDRMPGSVAVALAGLAQGVQMIRVHDVLETVQAVALWRASVAGITNE